MNGYYYLKKLQGGSLVNILKFLDLKSIMNVSLVNKAFNKECLSTVLWDKLKKRDFLNYDNKKIGFDAYIDLYLTKGLNVYFKDFNDCQEIHYMANTVSGKHFLNKKIVYCPEREHINSKVKPFLVFHLSNIETLCINSKHMIHTSKYFKNLDKLKYLKIHGEVNENFPKNISDFINLKKVNIKGLTKNRDDFIFHRKKHSNFNLEDTINEYLMDGINNGNLNKILGLKKILKKHGHKVNIYSIGDIFYGSNLACLDLSHNNLVELPNSIFTIKTLKILRLNYNYICGISEDIGKLSELEELNLEDNLLDHLPKTINKLKKLSSLSMYNNQFKEIIDLKGMNLKVIFVDNKKLIDYEKPEYIYEKKVTCLEAYDFDNY